MQFKAPPPPPGIVFDTALQRSEHVLAMAVLYKLQSAREARAASLSVSTPHLRAAAFCDALARYLSGSGGRNPAPVGIPAALQDNPPANSMADAVLAERTPQSAPSYPHGIQKLNDTADVAALIRNAISAQQPGNAAVVVAGPLSNLAAALQLPDLAGLVTARARELVIAATAADLRADLPAAREVFRAWPGSVALVETPSLVFPGRELDARFAWAENHPVRDAYRAFQTMPYDAPLASAAAVVRAARPASGWFTVSEPGTIELANDASLRLVPGSGKHRWLRIAPGQASAATAGLVELITAQPPPPAAGRGGPKQE